MRKITLTEIPVISPTLLSDYPVPYYDIKGLKLSVANPLHCLLLQELNIFSIKKQISISNALNTAIDLLIEELKKETFRLEQLKILLNNFYLAAAVAFGVLRKNQWQETDAILKSQATENYLCNEQEVVTRLGAIYYQNLGITAENIQGIISEYLTACGRTVFDLDADFVLRIANKYVDNGRYKLITLLPDSENCDLFKSVLRGIQFNEDDTKALLLIKNDIQKCLATYASFWKCSFFGHHHNQRALAVKIAINDCKTLDDIRQILTNQKDILEGKEVSAISSLLPKRWSASECLVNKKQDFNSSGFYQAISNALLVMPYAKCINQRSQRHKL